MSLLVATQITALATAALAFGAVVTAVFAVLAFRKQSMGVRAVERQVSDQQELTQQQAMLIQVQAEQLELQRQQFADQRAANAKQAEVFELQARDLRDSILERTVEEELRRRSQAARVFLREARTGGHADESGRAKPAVTATVLNSSDLPVYDAKIAWRRPPVKRGDGNAEITDGLGTIMPGDEACASREFTADTDMEACAVVLTFRDAAGVMWVSRSDGTLRDSDAETRSAASLPRKVAGLLKREVRDLVADYLARNPPSPEPDSAPQDRL
jgi:hypothetical protein